MKHILTITMMAAALATSYPLMAQAKNVSAETNNDMSATHADSASNDAQMGNDKNWAAQQNYWRGHYSERSYFKKDRDYSAYEPAYRYGVTLYNQNPGKSYDELNQSQLNKGWSSARSSSNLDWNDAQLATRDAYNRMYENRNMSSNASPAR